MNGSYLYANVERLKSGGVICVFWYLCIIGLLVNFNGKKYTAFLAEEVDNYRVTIDSILLLKELYPNYDIR